MIVIILVIFEAEQVDPIGNPNKFKQANVDKLSATYDGNEI